LQHNQTTPTGLVDGRENSNNSFINDLDSNTLNKSMIIEIND